MDDFYVSTDPLEKATNFRRDLQTVLTTDGFNFTKWMSHNLEFNQSTPESDMSNSAPVETNTKVIDRVPGVKWNPIDNFYLLQPTSFQNTSTNVTQRTFLRNVSSIFDPLGMSSPIQIRVRTSLQRLWKGNQLWDRPLSLEDYPGKRCFEEVENLSTIHIKRFNFEVSKKPVHKRILVFSDASEKAIANVAFLRTVFFNNSVSLNFILGKALVAPIERITTRNLELLAATNGAKISQFIKKEQNFSFDSPYIG